MPSRTPVLLLMATLCLAPTRGAAQSRAGSFAAVGATVGAVGLGSFVGLVAAGLCEMAVCDGEFTHGFVAGATVGAAGGALLGAGIGALVERPLEDSAGPAGRADGAPSPWAWHVHYGRPAGHAGGPPPGSAVRVGVDYGVRPRLAVGAGVVRLGFVETQRAFDPTDPVGPFADEDASAVSLLIGAAYTMDEDDHVRVRVAAGGARTDRTTVVTVPVPVRRTETIEESLWGVHLGGGIEAGWTVASTLRMGFELRADWISRTPMGDLPFYTIAVALWG